MPEQYLRAPQVAGRRALLDESRANPNLTVEALHLHLLTGLPKARYSLDSALDEGSKIHLFCGIIYLVRIDPKYFLFQQLEVICQGFEQGRIGTKFPAKSRASARPKTEKIRDIFAERNGHQRD
jgi:hypothetical protein